MDLIRCLAELVQQVRQGTLQLLDMADPAQLTWSPRGTSNHILWHAGHALWVQDALTIRPLTGRSELPPDWETTFGQGSRPTLISNWSPASEVSGQLTAQLDRLLQLLDENAKQIIANADKISPHTRWPLLPGIIHACHDEARHQGEMYLLYKLCASRSTN